MEDLDVLFRHAVEWAAVAGLVVTVLVGTMAVYVWGLYGAAMTALLSNVINLALRWRGLTLLANKS